MSKCPKYVNRPLVRRRDSRRAPAAFTLLEVLVATTLLATGILGVLAVFSLSVRSASAAEHLDDAVQLAGNHLELAVAMPPDRLPPVSGNSGRYAWTINFTEKPEGLVLATVRVTWSEGGSPRAFQLEQLFKPDTGRGPDGGASVGHVRADGNEYGIEVDPT